MYISKNVIVRRIRQAAKNYKQHLISKTYMFVFDNRYIEVMFTTKAFFHLTGVNSNLTAENFYKHAIANNGLRPSEIFFDSSHPFDFANLKTQYLKDLFELTIKDILIADDLITTTATYELALMDLQITLCLGRDTDINGNIISNRWVPYSFRVEETKNQNIGNLYEVTHIFCRNTNAPKTQKYNNMTFGNKNAIANLPQEIKELIDENL